jgi:hypothetical protein
MSLLKNQTSANQSLDFFGSGGGGGSGPAIVTSSITTSTITGEGGSWTNFMAGPGKPGQSWVVGLDGASNVSEILSGSIAGNTYRDIRASNAVTASTIQLVREEISAGFAQIGYITNPTAAPATGLRFLSSLNGGADATALITASDYFPLGQSLIPFASLNPVAPAGAGAVLTAGFNVVPNHLYGISFQVSEAVTGVPAPQDRVSYVIGGQVLDTIPHTQISTLQGVNPNGRTVNSVFRAPTNSVQLAVSNNSASLQSTLVTCENTYINGAVIRDLGPQITLP